ncbi:unnamed protein product [Rhodiola kirilowii]
MDSHPSLPFQFAKENKPISLNSKYILPEHERPHLSQVSSSSIPIINLQHNHAHLVHQVSQACQQYGFFQIINHGVPCNLSDSVMNSSADFFQLPHQIRAQMLLSGYAEQVMVYNPSLKVKGQDDDVNMWSESLSHPCDLSDHNPNLFPPILQKHAPKYCETIGEYARHIDALVRSVLSLMSLGLGLEQDCLEIKIGEKYVLRAHTNYYPPCPDPDRTMGLSVHTDINALTILRQSDRVAGLQVLKEGKWVWVEPLPNAFVVNVGDQIQVLSNGRYKSVHHRAVTNKESPRISLAMFYIPNKDRVIEPVEDLIDDEHPALYRRYLCSEFLAEFYKQAATRWRVMETFEIKPDK